jgi:YVTN family beta-propeller protein
MRIARRGVSALLLLLAGLLGGPALPAGLQTAKDERLPAPTDKLLIVLSLKDATARVFLAAGDRLNLLRTIPTGKGPQDVCIAPDGKSAYVTNGLEDSITVVDLDHLKVTGKLTPANLKSPTGVAMTPDGKKLYVGARGANLLLALSPAGQVLKEIAVADPSTVAISPAGRRAYVASDSTQSVLVLDTATDAVVATIKTGRQPRGIAFTPDGKSIIITCVSHDVMHLVDAATNEVKATIGAGRSLQSAAVAPDGRLAFTVTRDVRDGGVVSAVSVVDLRGASPRKVKDIPVGSMAYKVLVSRDGAYLYVTSTCTTNPLDNVAVIDLLTMEIARFAQGGAGAAGMALRN